jgi:hypothetical protein
MSVQSTAQIDTFAAHSPAWWRPPPRRTTCTRVHSHLTSALFTTAGFTQRWTRREDGNVRLVVCNAGGNKHGTSCRPVYGNQTEWLPSNAESTVRALVMTLRKMAHVCRETSSSR